MRRAKKATEARKVRRKGADPIQAKREAEAAARIEAAKAITFGAAAKRFISRWFRRPAP